MDEELIGNLTEMDEIQCLLNLYNEAKAYLEEFDWCSRIINSWNDREYSFYDKVGIFLFEIEPANPNIDDFVWIIVGDLPTVYLDKSASSGAEAVEIYCELMEDWIERVVEGKSIANCFPIPNEPTLKNATLLKFRTKFIREHLLNTA